MEISSLLSPLNLMNVTGGAENLWVGFYTLMLQVCLSFTYRQFRLASGLVTELSGANPLFSLCSQGLLVQ